MKKITLLFLFFSSLCGYSQTCADVTAFTENFDSYPASSTSMPACWLGVTVGSATVNITGGGGAPSTGPNRLSMTGSGTTSPVRISYAILPNVSNLNAGTHRLKFKAYSTFASRTFDVGYFLDVINKTGFTIIKTIDLPSTAPASTLEFDVYPLSTIPDGVKNLVFKNAGSSTLGQTTLFIDDVIWQPIPPCKDLKNVIVKTTNSSTSMNLLWDVTGTETAWQYAATLSTVTDPSTIPTESIIDINQSTVVSNGTNRSSIVNNLTASTTYKIWVRSNCGNGAVGLWSVSTAFSTPCTQTTSLVEDFDQTTNLPSCWRKLGGSSTGTVSVVASKGRGNTNALQLFNGTASNDQIFAAIPPLSTATTAGYRLRFTYKTTGSANGIIEIVNYSDAINFTGATADYTVLKSITIASANTEIDFNEALLSAQTPYLAIRFTHSSTNQNLYIDNLVWETMPACASDVSAITLKEVTDASVKLGFTSSGTEGQWQYALGTPTTTDPSTLSPTDFVNVSEIGTSKIGSITGLASSSSFKIWIRSKCNDSSLGAWVGPFYFTTNCPAVATFTQDFNSSLNLPSCWNKVSASGSGTPFVGAFAQGSGNVLKIEGKSTSDAAKGIVAIPTVSNYKADTHLLRFKLSGSVVGAKVEIGYLINPLDPTTFISLNRTYSATSTTTYTDYVADLGLEPVSQVLAFRNLGLNSSFSSVYIDDVVWEAKPTCPDISGRLIKSATSSTVKLSWTRGTSEGDWQYALTDTAETDPAKLSAVDFINPIIDGQTISSTLSDLTPSTKYSLWVRPKCTSTLVGVWGSPLIFSTTCPPVDGISETFDAGKTMPACWKEVGTTGLVSVVTIGGERTTNVLRLQGNGTIKTVVALPAANYTKDGTYRLRFKFRSSVTNPNIHVGYVTNTSDPSTFTLIESFTGTTENVFYSKTVLTGNKPTSEILAFRNQGAYELFIDDVYWEFIPTCSDISNITTLKSTSNSTDLSWKTTGPETAWQYTLGTLTDINPTAAAVDFETPTVTGTDKSGSIKGLSPSTSYKIWLRSKCDTSFGVWSDPIFVTTNCPLVETFTQNFDDSVNVPSCWGKVGVQGTADVKPDTEGTSGSNNLFMSSNTATSQAVIAMPPVSNAADGTHRLRFKFKGNIQGGALEIGYLKVASDPTSFTSFNPSQTFTVTTADTYRNVIATLGAQPEAEVLAFRNSGPVGTTALSLNIDDVVWETIPSCLEISGLTPNKTMSDNVELGWRAGGSETAWQYALVPSTDPDPTVLSGVDFVDPTIVNSVVAGKINKLMPATTYKIWLRAKCTDTSFGAWSDPINFTTSCAPLETFTQDFDASVSMPTCWRKTGGQGTAEVKAVTGTPSGSNALYMNCTANSAKPVVAMLPVSNTSSGTHRLRFKFKGNAVGSVIEVGYLKVLTDPTSFVSLNSFSATSPTAYEYAAANLGTQPLSEILAFRNAGVSSFYIDDVIWEPLPTCPDVKNLAVKSLTTNTATINWVAGDSETKWQYIKGTSADNDPADMPFVDVTQAPSEITLNDLTPATSYRVWVRSICDETKGTWIGPLTIATPCAVASDFNENFDATDVNTIPTCWKKVGSQGTANVIIKTSGPASPSGTKSLFMNSVSKQTRPVVAMPELNNISDGTHLLKFKLAGSTKSIGVDVGYLTDVSNPASFVPIQGFLTTAANVFQQQELVINDAPVSQVLAFRNNYDGNSVWIDDVSWEPLPAAPDCANATEVPDANCGNFATVISWPEVASAKGYRLTVGTTSGGSDVVNNLDLRTKLTYSVSGVANKTYYYTVKPYNLGGIASGCEEKSFTTIANACYCVSAPISKDGNGITAVLLGASAFVVPIGPDTYVDFTSNQVNLAQGASTNLRVSFNTGFTSDTVNVWIDFNNNKVFEYTEIVFTGLSDLAPSTVLNASFIMDSHAALGLHRMRIGSYLGNTDPDPCYSGSKGMTVDLNVNIVAPPANDYTLGAETLIVGNAFGDNALAGTNMNATGSVLEMMPSCGSYSGSDVWYKAIVPDSGNITFEVNSVDGGITNTAAAVYTSNLVLIACDDSSSTAGKLTNADQPKIELSGRTPGEILYLRVWENGGDAYGDYLVSAYDNSAVLATDIFDKGNLAYYPNPVKDVLNISFDQEISDVVVMNLLGQQVISKSVNANQTSVDMTNLSAGTYLVKITIGNQSKTIKAVRK